MLVEAFFEGELENVLIVVPLINSFTYSHIESFGFPFWCG